MREVPVTMQTFERLFLVQFVHHRLNTVGPRNIPLFTGRYRGSRSAGSDGLSCSFGQFGKSGGGMEFAFEVAFE